MKQGWISVHRQIQDHWLWAEKPFSKGQAWIDMLLLANHEDKQILLDSKVVKVLAGSFITSEVKLAERWGWSRHKVRDFLDLLKGEKMINKVSDSRRTTIFVDNYAEYQVSANTQKDRSGTGQGQVRDINNNENNANKELYYPLSMGSDVDFHFWQLIRNGKYVSREEVKRILEEKGVDELYRIYGIEGD
ncbi:MAG: hypothetical protein IKW45_05365 [Clostridia bacterium]|nr:hypothetical protein [Clostridia bacterium]